MATGTNKDLATDTVELPATDGVAFVGLGSPLTRLHYFDGQYLRARLLTREQDYHRETVRLANLAGGWGVVHGLSLATEGDQLRVGEGLAITPTGRFVLAPEVLQARIADLLKVAAPGLPRGHENFADCLEPSKTATATTPGLAIYEVTVGPIEGLCGNEPVYGKLCDTACASDSRHPYWREGVVLRLRPVALNLPTSSAITAATAHLRNRIASAYFAAEPGLPRSLLSAAGLASEVWCQPAQLYQREEVVIGLLAREGSTVRVLDAWAGRRERMEAQARGYWQGRMAMRPWNVFLAQVLQFQCQLAGLFDPGKPVILPADDCEELRAVLAKARKEIDVLLHRYGTTTKKLIAKTAARPTLKEYQSVASDVSASFADLDGLSSQLAEADTGGGALPQQRMLLNAGFFELPPAGYLPVAPNADVQEQLRRMFGEGVALHFHAVAPDEIGELVEEAQHLRRISLTRGLDDPKRLEPVEIFLPDGEVGEAQAKSDGTWWRTAIQPPGTRLLLQILLQAQRKPAPQDTNGAAKDVLGNQRTAFSQISLPDVLSGVLDGVLRSEAREDGTFGFAVAAQNDALQPEDNTIETGANTDIQPETGPRLETNFSRTTVRIGMHAAGDGDKDPFGLPIGGSTRLTCEGRMLLGGATGELWGELSAEGSLTVLARRTLPSGMEERLVQADLRMSLTGPDGGGNSETTRVRLLLSRDGDGRTGVFLVDDERQDPRSSAIQLEWDDNPRRAELFMLTQGKEDAAVAVIRKLSSLRTDSGLQTGAGGSTGTQPPGTRSSLAQLSALPGMPALDSALGTAAMTTLSALADATDDAGFLVRARRRLFPVLDAARSQAIVARQDWVMFRRARTHLFAPPAGAAVSTATETFQVWHLKLENTERLAVLAKALEAGDAKTLAGFAFQRVGLLRYRDESAFSEETPDRVLAMWRPRDPAPRVALARAWENAPGTGQGWQNHMRLRNMLEQIRLLTQPPARGDGSIATIAAPPGLLGDGAYDGGMLVVTVGAPTEAVAVPHRLVLVPEVDFLRMVESLPDDALTSQQYANFLAMLGRAQPMQDLIVQFESGALGVEEQKKVDQAHSDQDGIPQFALRMDARAIAAGVNPLKQHELLVERLGAPQDKWRKTAPVDDFGNGAQVLTLVGCRVTIN